VDLSVLELSLRLGVAAAAAVLLGLDRELHGQAAGIRTHALVAVGAALFTVTGAYGFSDVDRGPDVDPARIAAQVASGVGFLGAGAILRQGFGVKGLTTAATLWLSAALGVASGAGAYPAVAVGTILMLIILVALRLAKPWLARWSGTATVIEIDYARGHGTLGPILRSIDGVGSRLEHLALDDDDEGDPEGLRHVSLFVNASDVGEVYAAAEQLRNRPEVRAVRVTGPSTH